MTIRDIVISFGFVPDKASEKKVNDSISTLKTAASDALEGIGVRFVTDVYDNLKMVQKSSRI